MLALKATADFQTFNDLFALDLILIDFMLHFNIYRRDGSIKINEAGEIGNIDTIIFCRLYKINYFHKGIIFSNGRGFFPF